jgi:hypothetical protein
MDQIKKKSKKNIIFYLKGYGNPTPGAQSAGFNILKSIYDNSDYNIIIISDQTAKKSNNELLYKHKNFFLKIPFLNFVVNNFLAARIIKKVSKIYSPKLIFIQGYSGYYPTFKSKFKTLLTLHDDPTMRIFDKNRKDPLKYFEFLWYEYIRFSMMRAIKRYDFFHVLNLRTLKYLTKLGIERERIIKIRNAVGILRNFNKENIISQNGTKIKTRKRHIIILTAGSIECRKGSLNIALSLNYLPKNFHLIIVGNPQPIFGLPYLKKILTLNRKRIHYVGYLQKKEYFTILSKADIFIGASKFESYHLTPLEALMMHKKLVATPVGVLPEYLSLDYPFLIRTNEPSEIAELILKAYNSELLLVPNDNSSLILSWKDFGKYLYSNDEIINLLQKVIAI